MIAATPADQLRPADLFSRGGAPRVLLLDTPEALEIRIDTLLDSMSEGRYHPLHLQPRGATTPLASGYLERSPQGYHLCLHDTHGSTLLNAQAVPRIAIYLALRRLSLQLLPEH